MLFLFSGSQLVADTCNRCFLTCFPPFPPALLQAALGMDEDIPPPWLINMQRYGPPPSYPSLKIPGLNAPIPSGGQFGYHPGGWGKPPVDEGGNPIYGDVFAQNDEEVDEDELVSVGAAWRWVGVVPNGMVYQQYSWRVRRGAVQVVVAMPRRGQLVSVSAHHRPSRNLLLAGVCRRWTGRCGGETWRSKRRRARRKRKMRMRRCVGLGWCCLRRCWGGCPAAAVILGA